MKCRVNFWIYLQKLKESQRHLRNGEKKKIFFDISICPDILNCTYSGNWKSSGISFRKDWIWEYQYEKNSCRLKLVKRQNKKKRISQSLETYYHKTNNILVTTCPWYKGLVSNLNILVILPFMSKRQTKNSILFLTNATSTIIVIALLQSLQIYLDKLYLVTTWDNLKKILK